MSNAGMGKAASSTWPRTVELTYPVKYGNTTVTSVTMRRAVVRDHMAANANANGDVANTEIELVARVCGVDRDVIEMLDWLDYAAITDLFGDMAKKPKARTAPTHCAA
jgi:hypothetical protein